MPIGRTVSGLMYWYSKMLYNAGLVHGSYFNVGGVSPKEVGSMNVLERVDKPENVAANLDLIRSHIGAYQMIRVGLVGEDKTVVITDRDSPLIIGGVIAETDSVIVDNVDHEAFFHAVADFISLILYEPRLKIAALVHCTWRHINTLPQRTITEMLSLGCEVKNLCAAFAPSIGPCCYHFPTKEVEQHTDPFWQPYLIEDLLNGQTAIDIRKLSLDSLLCAGVPFNNIDHSRLCNACLHGLLPSNYLDGEKAGRFATVIMTI